MILHSDCMDALKEMKTNSVDSLVTDPPAGISFMGKNWDHDKGGRTEWILWMKEILMECHRVMKPGAHGLVWAIPRTSHWTATACEDAGFRIKDAVQHIFGSGFPKSHSCKNIGRPELGSALKPAVEIWWLIQKPLEKGLTIDKNVLKHGTGAINIDASRIGTTDNLNGGAYSDNRELSTNEVYGEYRRMNPESFKQPQGRFPANLLLSHSEYCEEMGTKKVKGITGGTKPHKNEAPITQHGGFKETENRAYFNHASPDGTETVAAWNCADGCPVAELDLQSGVLKSGTLKGTEYLQGKVTNVAYGTHKGHKSLAREGDSGGASRFFYVAKASKADKNAGCDLSQSKAVGARPNSGDSTGKFPDHDQRERVGNFHPTVKSTKLMSYLITLVTPPNGIVLDPFAGSGSTGVAAIQSGFKFIGIELEKEYVEIANKRIYHAFPEFKKQVKLEGSK